MPRRINVRGHALERTQWSGARGPTASTTAFCRCGWHESASSQKEARIEYRFHLEEFCPRGHRAQIEHEEPSLGIFVRYAWCDQCQIEYDDLRDRWVPLTPEAGSEA